MLVVVVFDPIGIIDLIAPNDPIGTVDTIGP